CTGGSVTAAAGANSITVTSRVVPASTASASSCTITVDVTNVPLQTGTCPDANLTDTSANISRLSNLTNAVTSSCVGVNPLVPSLNKAFSPSAITIGGTATLTFTVTNPAASNPAQTVSFTDTLPSKLQIATNPNVGGTCTGGSVTAAAGGTTITVTSRVVPASTASASSCTITVDVTNVPLQTGTCPDANLTNQSANISGLSNLTNAVTPSCVTVNPLVPSLNKAFSPTKIGPGGVATLTFTVTNPAASNPPQTVSFTDTLPSKLQVAPTPNVGGTCTAGSVSAAPGSNTITVTSRTVPGSTASASSCTITVDVTNVPLQTGTCPDANLTDTSANIG